jgi:O-acetylhomoserine (thiol)-lyase
VIHPASTTHRQMNEADQRGRRDARHDPLSIGIETLDDILWDIDQALERSAS